jgi:hypothetical protein
LFSRWNGFPKSFIVDKIFFLKRNSSSFLLPFSCLQVFFS